MSVLIDGTAVPSELGGVGRYLEGLVVGLTESHRSFALVVRREHEEHFRRLAPDADVITAPRFVDVKPFRFAWEQLCLPWLRIRSGARALHSPHYTFPLWARHRVVTIHDATFFSDPASHGRLKRAFFSFWIRASLRCRLVCIVPSHSTASELLRFVGSGRASVSVAHHGVDHKTFLPPTGEEIDEVRHVLGLAPGRPWLAFLGTIEPRKNVGALLAAHARLRGERGASNVPDLVVAGARGWDADASAALDRLGPDDGVREVGYLPFASLPAFLGGATVVAYPSSAEGFGLPVLEAMSCGSCVLTTDASALPEVGGQAVAYSRTDVDSLTASLRTLLDDPDRRAALGRAGIARAAGFTWAACAEVHVTAYEDAA
ncbi:glycosyltransferase [Frigoribacterium sp. CFBP 8751]|uniref:glycosyltransferase n=1 Tax=Frigoribacterium sp. CFBP 8751 TaxID=2775277 RepID=UPI00177F024C|nr:glycosyltransferase family 4 protein [Frigoribacterium sp. CFBP 8751]